MTHAVRRTRLVAPLVALALAATLAPGAAQAATWRHEDATGDVARLGDGGVVSPAPRARGADVTDVVVRHRRHALVIKLALVDHRRGSWGAGALVRLPSRTVGVAVLSFTRPRATVYELDGDEIDCPGFTWTSSFDEDRVRLRVPTSCLGQPRKVRVGAYFARYRHLGLEGITVDDPQADRLYEDTPKLSPWITRG